MAISNSIIGNSKTIRDTLASASRVARTLLSVLITGESGTGKELFARFIHDESARAGRPYVAINCAAIPAELLEAELFGYKKGAFSGATHDRDGLFVQAHGGTIFLDEIGDMPLPLQAKILRVLQEGEVRPVGGKDVQKVDVRVVAATHRDLKEMADQGKFREDLLFRLRGYALHLPPLREREQDIIQLARSFLKFQLGLGTRYLSQDAQDLLLTYHWPGNIRELRNTVLAAAVDASRCIEARHLRPHLTEPDTKSMAKHVKLLDNLLLDAMVEVGQITLAQLHDRLSIPKSTLHRRLQQMVETGRVHRLVDGGWVRFTSGTAGEKTAAFLPDRQSHALRLAREAGRITRQQFAEAVGISLRTASRELATMVDLGLLIPDGRGGKMGGYVYQQTGTL